MHTKTAFCIKASVLFLTLLLTGFSSQAAIITDTTQCDSSLVYCETFTNSDIIAEGTTQVANELYAAITNPEAQSSYKCSESQNPQELICNIGPDDAPLDLTCTIDAEGNSVNCKAKNLNTDSSILMKCDTGSESCTTTINTDTLCAEDQAICESVVARAKLCEVGSIDCGELSVTQTQTNADIFADVISSTCSSSANSDNSDGLTTFCRDFSSKTDAEKEQIIKAVMPTKIDLSADAGMMSMQQVSSYISSRLSQLRVTPAKVSSNNKKPENLYPVAGQWLPAFTQLAQLEGMSNTASDVSPAANDSLDATINISKDGRFSLYVNAAFMFAKQDTTADESASDSKTAQFTIGSDYRLSNELVLGAAFTFSDMNSDFGKNKEDSLNQQSYNLSLYTLYYHKQWWLDGSLMLGFNRYDQERDITCSGSCSSLNNTYEANYNGNVQSLTLSSGYDFVFSRLTLSPFAQLQGGTVNIEAYDESAKKTGGATALLSLDKQSRDFANINIGSYLRYVLNTKKAVFIPSLRVVLNHSLEDDIQSVSGHFVGDESARFSMAANAMDDTYLTIGAGMNFQLQNGNSGFIDLETIEAYDNLNQYRITGGWRWEF